MADGARPEELALLWKALAALASACSGGFLFLFAYIQRGKAALWAHVNQQTRDRGEDRVEAARLYATKEDLDTQSERLERRIADSEIRILAAIRDRPPVRTGRTERG